MPAVLNLHGVYQAQVVWYHKVKLIGVKLLSLSIGSELLYWHLVSCDIIDTYI